MQTARDRTLLKVLMLTVDIIRHHSALGSEHHLGNRTFSKVLLGSLLKLVFAND